MRAFLEVQRSTMLGYLKDSTKEPRIGRPIESKDRAPRTLKTDELKPPGDGHRKPSPPPDGQGTDRSTIAARLLKIVQERTGYPAEMLKFELDLEARPRDRLHQARRDPRQPAGSVPRARDRLGFGAHGGAFEGEDAGGDRRQGRVAEPAAGNRGNDRPKHRGNRRTRTGSRRPSAGRSWNRSRLRCRGLAAGWRRAAWSC